MATLAIDIDGCLANFTEAFGQALIDITGRDCLPEGWRVRPDFPATWNWHLDAGYTPSESDKVWKKAIETSPSFWYDLAPFPDTKATLRQLDRLSKNGHNVYFLTHRMGKRCKLQTEQWLRKHGATNPTVILSGNKTPILEAIEADFFVDDKPSTLQDVCQKLGEQGKWFLKDAPYNRDSRPTNLLVAGSVEHALRMAGLWQDTRGKKSTRREFIGL